MTYFRVWKCGKTWRFEEITTGVFTINTGVASRFTTQGETRICRPGTRTSRKARPTRGSRGHGPLGKLLKFVSLKWHFPHSDGTFEQKLNI